MHQHFYLIVEFHHKWFYHTSLLNIVLFLRNANFVVLFRDFRWMSDFVLLVLLIRSRKGTIVYQYFVGWKDSDVRSELFSLNKLPVAAINSFFPMRIMTNRMAFNWSVSPECDFLFATLSTAACTYISNVTQREQFDANGRRVWHPLFDIPMSLSRVASIRGPS